MQRVRNLLVRLLVMLLASFQPMTVDSAETAAPSAPLPKSYRLEAVKLVLQRQPANGQPKQVLEVTGSGSSHTFGHPAETHAFTLPAADVLELLNGLYRLRFFDLPAVLHARPSVFLRPDGTVGTQATKKMDVVVDTVCVSLPGYEKCVNYAEGDAPPELEAWAKAAFSDAQRRMPPATPKQ